MRKDVITDVTGLKVEPGDRIRLVEMPNDPCPVEPGSLGTATNVTSDGLGAQAWMAWDSGRTLSLVSGDRFEIIGVDPTYRRDDA